VFRLNQKIHTVKLAAPATLGAESPSFIIAFSAPQPRRQIDHSLIRTEPERRSPRRMDQSVTAARTTLDEHDIARPEV
jgi:hypothetical protein